MNKSNSSRLRADAARALLAILDQGQSSRECLPDIQRQHTEKDKAWIQEMVFGVLRQLPLLQYWLRKLLDKPLKKKAKVVEHLIMLGLYQLAFTRVSTHAAVSETVAGAKQLKHEALKGLVNGILRNFIRQELEKNMPEDRQIMSGQPKWLFNQLEQHYQANLPTLIQAMQQRAPIWLRVNRQKIDRSDYLQHLEKRDIGFDLPPNQPDGVVLHKSCDVTQLPGFDDGWFAVQDGAAQLAVDYLSPQKNERILDCCAAPGGKTCHILERQPAIAECIALDVDESRLIRIEENLTRLGLDARLVCADANQTSEWWDEQPFDRILLDAPCSATGVIRRHPDIKWLRKGSDISSLCEMQSNLLDTMWALLKPGGTLLYATCSILPQENSQQIAQFMARHGDATHSPVREDSGEQSNLTNEFGRQILPGEEQMDGFYYARLLKSKEQS